MKPLTVDELRKLKVGDWVWLIADKKQGYAKVLSVDTDAIRFETSYNAVRTLFYENYIIKKNRAEWVVYRNKEEYYNFAAALRGEPQAETKGEIVELPCKVGERVFMPYFYNNESGIMELTIEQITIFNTNILMATNFETDDADFAELYGGEWLDIMDCGKIYFTVKTEAEARLAELKGEKL